MKACSAETVASPSGGRWKELQLSQTESISVHPSRQTVAERKRRAEGGGKKNKKQKNHIKMNPPTKGRGGGRVERNKVSGTRKGRGGEQREIVPSPLILILKRAKTVTASAVRRGGGMRKLWPRFMSNFS